MIFHFWLYNILKDHLFFKDFKGAGGNSVVTTSHQIQNIELFIPLILNLTDKIPSQTVESINSIVIAGISVHAFKLEQFIVIITTINGLNSIFFHDFIRKIVKAVLELEIQNKLQNIQNNNVFSEKLETYKLVLDESIEKSNELVTKRAEAEFWKSIDTLYASPQNGKRKNRYLLLGLGKAGKSSVYYQFIENWNLEQIESIKPTVDRWISKLENKDNKDPFLIYDLGGQQQYIKKHLKDNKLFKNLRCLIFIIDVQNFSNSQSVLEYFNSILNKVMQNNENPAIAIFLHKFDPGIQTDLYPKVSNWMKTIRSIFTNFPQTTYYLTSVKDDSAIKAMARTFLFTMPHQFLAQTMNSSLIAKAADSLSHLIAKLDKENSFETNSLIKEEIYLNSIPIGYDLAEILIKDWIQTFQAKKSDYINLGQKFENENGLKLKTANRRVAIYFKTKIPLKLQHIHAIGEITQGLLEGLGGLLGLSDALLLDKKVKNGIVECMIEMVY